MTATQSGVFLLLLCLPGFLSARAPSPGGRAAGPVSYSRQIRPLFERACLGCHSGPNAASGYNMETRERLLKGGRHGTAVLPGKGAESPLVRYLTGDQQPRMPSGAPPFDNDTVALVRRWVDEGAAFDAAPAPVKPAPAVTNAAPAPVVSAAPVTALAYSPDGKYLAASGFRAVRLLDPATGAVVRTLRGPADQVQALAWAADGRTLVVAGGLPGVKGEVLLLDAETGRTVRTLGIPVGHADVVDAVSWRPGTRELATGSMDKTVRVWDADTGRCVRVIKEHADAVLGLAYSPDGKYLATAAADRTAKLLDAATGKPLSTLQAHGDAVTGVAFRGDGALLATCGADKTVRVWKVAPGQMQNPERTLGEDGVILSCTFRPDGGALAYGAANRAVKLFSGDGASHQKTLPDVTDWAYAVAFSPDGKTLTVGSQDGAVLFWDTGDGKLLRKVRLASVVASRAGGRP